MQNLESKEESGFSNPFEVKIISRIIECLREYTQIKLSHVGIIAPYRAQIKALATALPLELHINTVDKFQGNLFSI